MQEHGQFSFSARTLVLRWTTGRGRREVGASCSRHSVDARRSGVGRVRMAALPVRPLKSTLG
jgi:hypothetical protein